MMRCAWAQTGGKERHWAGFTLVELLVSLSIVSLVMAIALPGFSSLRRQAVQMQGMGNLKEIHYAVNLFANDHGDLYPSSVSWVADKPYHPRRMVSSSKPSRATHFSMSGYLHEYISDMSVFTCPAAPEKLPDMQEMWDAGDDYTSRAGAEAFSGHYCFYWDYEAILEAGTEDRHRFRGPKGPGSGKKYSTLLVSDYLGKDNYTDMPGYMSCEWFEGASETPMMDISAVYWLDGQGPPDMALKAAFVDGHVETYTADTDVVLKIDDGTGSPVGRDGEYYIPQSGLPRVSERIVSRR